MNLILIPTPKFTQSVKKLIKKYRLILNDLEVLEKELVEKKEIGVDLGYNYFKVRVKNSSVPTGKSGGFRVIYFFKKENKIYLLDIYTKNEISNISREKILEMLKKNGLK